jgi:hypothetical protein
VIVEIGYIDGAGRAWDIHAIPNRYMGDEEAAWVATSVDASGDVMEAYSRAELELMLDDEWSTREE